ncbi:MAG TPA: efflux RND transporter periplasmic adaptor subunit [Thermoanaerobaculia bacterium]|nr:efflux RND transporter periplasmic adaptor subunit [Thermoanaerobaculia bacterium]
MKKVVIAVLVVLALGTLVFLSARAGGGDKGIKVYAEEVRRQDIGQIVKASGAIDPRIKVNISAYVVGKIIKLYAREGDHVAKGQPFLELEKQAYIAERDRLRAQIQQTRTEVHQAEVSLADASIKLARAKRLHTEGVITTEALESAQLAETSAKLRLDNDHEAVSSAQASLDRALDDLVKTTIFSPLSGIVVSLKAEEGEVVIPGTMNNPASVIATIADLSEILAKVDVDETEIVNVKIGQPATVKVDALPSRVYHGRVVEVGSSGFNRSAQPDVTFFEVKILLQESGEDLRPSMSLRAEIETRPPANALVVPIQAVVDRAPLGKESKDGKDPKSGKDNEVKVVFLQEQGKARQREVTTGVSDETRVEILSGLKVGETVVTGPYRSLRDLKDGDAVSITTEKEDSGKSTKKKAGDDKRETD